MIDKGVGNGRMATPFSDAADVPDLLEPHQVRETARDQLGLSLRPCGKVSGHNVFEDLDQCRVELVRRFRDKGRQIRAESLIQGHRLDVAVFGCGYSPEDYSLVQGRGRGHGQATKGAPCSAKRE
jgi:hypothetical protein